MFLASTIVIYGTFFGWHGLCRDASDSPYRGNVLNL